MKKKLVSMMLVLTTSISLCACGSSTEDALTADIPSDGSTETATADDSAAVDEDSTESAAEEGDLTAYYAESDEVYNANLGDFYDMYMKAKDATNVSERYALMAIAEAKLMEASVMITTNTRGGAYALSRVAPYTFDYTLWGNDYERYHQGLITTEFIKSEDRAEMKAKWKELKGTGTYEAWAKQFLVDKGYTLKDDYTILYPSDPATWDGLATSRSADSEAIINTYDGLMEYDVEGTLQPALAESYTVSDDGLTYTFKLREGLKWVDSQEREVADVKADDFVAGMQHMMDAQAGLEYLVQGIIVNASEYIGGDISDFSQVGVKAVDEYTVEYTLTEPCSYFMTMLGYGIFAPMSRDYYVSQGGKFGTEFDSSAADYNYGKDPNSIAYCGPYLVTNATEKNKISFTANNKYWNKDNINVKSLTWLYNDGTDPTKSYNDAVAGTIDGVALTTAALELAKKDGYFDTHVYISNTESTSFMNFYNLNRAAYANAADATTAVSAKSDEEKSRTKTAMNNVHFRRALSFGFDRASYQAQRYGEDLKYNALRNSYTPGNFVYTEEEVTVDINGTATTFPAGTAYGAMEQAQIDADGVAIKVYDPTAEDGVGSGDGFDGWYNVDNAKAELATAIEELAGEGVEISAENPIHIDMVYPSNDEVFTNMDNAYKISIESALDGAVVVDLVEAKNYDEWYYAGYYTDYGYEANYDVYDVSGWGPDYGDPQTYLDTFLPDGEGYMVKCIGIY